MAQRMVTTTAEQEMAISYLGGEPFYHQQVQKLLDDIVIEASTARMTKIIQLNEGFKNGNISAEEYLKELRSEVR